MTWPFMDANAVIKAKMMYILDFIINKYSYYKRKVKGLQSSYFNVNLVVQKIN